MSRSKNLTAFWGREELKKPDRIAGTEALARDPEVTGFNWGSRSVCRSEVAHA